MDIKQINKLSNYLDELLIEQDQILKDHIAQMNRSVKIHKNIIELLKDIKK